MLEDIQPGLQGELEWEVGEGRTVGHGGNEAFSTPSLVLFIEIAAAQVLRPHLASNQSSVGTRVDVRHLAATPKGMRVTAKAVITAVQRRRITFHVEVFDEVERVGEAEHERFVIDLDRYGDRLDEKKRIVAERTGA